MDNFGFQNGGGSGSAVQSVTGLNTDNTDALNPIVKISVDGTTIKGLGTPASPLVVESYLYIEIPVSSSQILSMGSSIKLLPPPGINKYYIIEQIAIEYTFNTLAYIFPTSLAFYLDGCFDSYIDKTILTSLTDTVATISGNLRNTYSVGSGSGSTLVKTNKDVLNADLIMGTQNNDNPINGNGTMLIKIWYKIETKG